MLFYLEHWVAILYWNITEMLVRCLKNWVAILYWNVTEMLVMCLKHWVAILYCNVMENAAYVSQTLGSHIVL